MPFVCLGVLSFNKRGVREGCKFDILLMKNHAALVFIFLFVFVYFLLSKVKAQIQCNVYSVRMRAVRLLFWCNYSLADNQQCFNDEVTGCVTLPDPCKTFAIRNYNLLCTLVLLKEADDMLINDYR